MKEDAAAPRKTPLRRGFFWGAFRTPDLDQAAKVACASADPARLEPDRVLAGIVPAKEAFLRSGDVIVIVATALPVSNAVAQFSRRRQRV